MDERILRTAALELQAVDSNDIVKVAGIFRRIKNWWKAFSDPKYRAEVDALKDQSVRIQDMLNGLNENIADLQAAIKDTDVPLYEKSLKEVRQLSLDLSRELYGFRQGMNTAVRNAPTQVIEEPEPDKPGKPGKPEAKPEAPQPSAAPKSEEQITSEPQPRWSYTAEELKNPDIRAQMKEQLPSDHDVPISHRIGKPLQSFNWFNSLGPNNVYLSENFIDNFQSALADALVRKISIYGDEQQDKAFYSALTLTPEIEEQIRQRLPEAILNGVLQRYWFQKPSEEVRNRAANEMLAVISSQDFDITLPASEFFDGPKTILVNALVFLNDLRASYVGSDLLSGAGTKFVRVVGHDDLQPQSPQQVVQEESKPEGHRQVVQEKQEQPIGAVTFPDKDGPHWILDVPGDRRRKFISKEKAVEFGEAGIGEGNISVLDADPNEKQAMVRKFEILRFADFVSLADLESHLRSLNLSEDVVQFIISQPDEYKQKYIQKARQNPLITVDDLQRLEFQTQDPVAQIRLQCIKKFAREVEAHFTQIDDVTLAKALINAYHNEFGQLPNMQALGLMYGQIAFEAGQKGGKVNLRNNNFGGITAGNYDKWNNGWLNSDRDYTTAKTGLKFKSYNSVDEGAADYIKTLKHLYPGSLEWKATGLVMDDALYQASKGYFGPEKPVAYAKGMDVYFRRFIKNVWPSIKQLYPSISDVPAKPPSNVSLQHKEYGENPYLPEDKQQANRVVSRHKLESEQYAYKYPEHTQQPAQSPELQQEYEDLMKILYASTGPLELMVRRALEKEALPTTKLLLSLRSDTSFVTQARFARILISALRAELGAESSIHSNGKQIEIETDVVGSEKPVVQAVEAVASGIQEAFKMASSKNVKTTIFKDCESSLNLLESSEIDFRKFAFEIMGAKW